MNETLMIAGCRQQHKKAQQQLFDRFASALLPVCIRYLKNFQEAEDALLNGFFKFFKNIEAFDYRGDGSVLPWLKKIMINECLMVLRRTTRITFEREKHAEQLKADDMTMADLNARELLVLIAGLPAGYRTVFNLYAIEGYSHKEIAALLGINEGTSKSQLSKARKLLQQALQKQNSYATGS